ncbi:MAG: hypothetical protein ACK2U0_18715 [Candidatus Promineifilaceae bacterium]|jgi:hypothetical protein
MISSGWQKQNFHVRDVGFAISLISAALLAVLFSALGIGKSGILISLLVVVLGFLVTLIISNRKSKSMTRILKFDYEEIDWDFRMLFKDNFIRYIKRTEDDFYSYEFPGYHLTMTVQPYAPPVTRLCMEMRRPKLRLRK